MSIVRSKSKSLVMLNIPGTGRDMLALSTSLYASVSQSNLGHGRAIKGLVVPAMFIATYPVRHVL